MAHLQSQIKGGYYPFPPEHLPALTSLLDPAKQGKASESGRILDPCAGEGDALKRLAEAWNLTPHANELDAGRAAACRGKFGPERSAQGDLMTLRTPNSAYSVVYVNPPYAENAGGADEKRREFEHLAHAWKWAQDGGFVLWVVYAQHMTERAASFLARHSSSADVYRIPGLHLGTYPQIVVVAKARPETRGENVDAEALRLVEACKLPNRLPLLEVHAEPVYRVPAPAHVKRFYFHPDEVTAELMLPALVEHGVQHTNTFQAIVETPPPPPELAPIVPPRGGQLGLILAAGLFNGLLLNLEEGPAAVRGVVRMTEINTTPPEMVGVRETIEHKAQVTISLLHKNGKVTIIESNEKDRLVAFIKAHKQAFLDYLAEHSKALYDFDYSRYAPVFDRVFRNRQLPGRPVTGLFETQKHVTAAMLTTLKKRRKVLLVGDMGVGKGPMAGTAIAALWREGKFRPGQVAVVLAPPHLIEKWKAELIDIIPGCIPHIADKDTATPKGASGGTLVDDVAAFMRRAGANPDTLHVLVLSRERAKLGEGWEAAYNIRRQRIAQWPKTGPIPRQFLDREGKLLDGVTRVVTEEIPICPTCAKPISSSQSGEGKTDPIKWMKTKPHCCHECGGALWQLVRTFSAPAAGQKFPKRNPRYPIASLLRERYADRVAIVVCDEVHENKSAASDQGRAMQNLVHIANYAIGMTGTLLGGTASSVFWLEWAFNNARMVKNYPLDEGIEPAINRWVRTMGVMVKVIEYKEDKQSGVYIGTDRHEHKPEEAPGISPLLIRELVDHCIWVGLADLAFALPEYKEIPVAVSLPPDVQEHYNHQKKLLLDYLISCKDEGDASFLGAYLQATLRYPSACYEAKPVVHRRQRKDGDRGLITQVVTTLQGFGRERIFPKEQALLDLLKEELGANRPCAVFIAQSGKVNIQERLVELIGQHVPAAHPVVLESDTVATDKRDGWLKKQVEKGDNVLICNPKLIETGLDLLAFKSLVFYEIAYSLYTVSQASRRHWRIGQTNECRVYHLYYDGTMEAQAIELVSEKQAAAALLGGDADGGGLAQLAGGAVSLEAELAKSIAADEAVVDVSKLFRQTAQSSADFTSGWATSMSSGGQVDESAIKAVPLANLVGKRFYHKAEAHQVVDYGPLDEASYQAKNLVSGAVELLPAEIVERASVLPPSAPLTLHQRRVQPEKQTVPTTVIADAVTPLRQQYLNIKQQFPNAILLARLGDFYEAFDADAEIVARELDVVLTSRNISKGKRVPMAGVPHHAAESFIARLIEKGYHVAICEQTGDEPVEGLVPREVVRVVTPKRVPRSVPQSTPQDVPQAEKQPLPALPDTLLLAAYHAAKRKHPRVLALIERGEFFYAYGEDAQQVAKTLNAVLDSRLIEGVRVEQAAIPAKDVNHYVSRLSQAGFKVAVARQKVSQKAAPPTQPTEHALPSSLAEAYARFREMQKPDVLTFIEMADAFVSFEGDAITASQRLHKPHGVRALPGGPSLQVLSLPKGSHEAAFKRLQKVQCTVAVVNPVAGANGRVELLAPEPRPEALKETPPKAPLLPRRSPEQLRAMSEGQLALL